MHISQSDCPAEIPWTYKNVVLYSPDPPFLFSVEGGSGDETRFRLVLFLTTTLSLSSLDVTKAWCETHVCNTRSHSAKHSSSMGSFLLETIFWSTPNGVLMAHTEWLPGVQLRHFSTTSTIYRLWGLVVSSCRGLVAERWRLNPEVSWVRLPATA